MIPAGARAGEWLAGLGGAALLAVMLLPWYREGADLTAWQAFSVLDVLLALFAPAGIAVLVLGATRRAPALPVAAVVAGTALGVVMTLLVVYRLLNAPGPDDAVELRPGAWLGLLSVLAVTAGSWRAMADERTDALPVPEVAARPAPPAIAPAGSNVARGVAPGAGDLPG